MPADTNTPVNNTSWTWYYGIGGFIWFCGIVLIIIGSVGFSTIWEDEVSATWWILFWLGVILIVFGGLLMGIGRRIRIRQMILGQARVVVQHVQYVTPHNASAYPNQYQQSFGATAYPSAPHYDIPPGIQSPPQFTYQQPPPPYQTINNSSQK